MYDPVMEAAWAWEPALEYDAAPAPGHVTARALLDADGEAIVWPDGCENAYLSIDQRAARLIKEIPAFLALARYAVERGEGDAEMADKILSRLGYCAVCRRANTDETSCTCGMG